MDGSSGATGKRHSPTTRRFRNCIYHPGPRSALWRLRWKSLARLSFASTWRSSVRSFGTRYSARFALKIRLPRSGPGDILQPRPMRTTPAYRKTICLDYSKRVDSPTRGATRVVMLYMSDAFSRFYPSDGTARSPMARNRPSGLRGGISLRSRMKAPEGKRTPHIVPLSTHALATLTELWKLRKDDKWVFPSHFEAVEHITLSSLTCAFRVLWGIAAK